MSGAQWTWAIVLVGFCVVYPTVGALTWKGFVRDAKANKPGVRMRAYVELLLVQWPVVAVLLGAWCWDGRTLTSLGLGRPDLAGWIALSVVAGVAVLVVLQIRAFDPEDPKLREAVIGGLGETRLLLPHDARENRWFRAVAVTAGVCEEIVYRGVLTVLLAEHLPTFAAIAVATVAFGAAHAYQGARGIVKVIGFSSVLALVAWLGESLWPVIVLHAVIDLQGGAAGYAVSGRRADDVSPR
jgi:membrane protease YdiL (CAAX protease family)